MKHMQWYKSLPNDAQTILEDWAEIGSPTARYQRHYLVEEVAEALRLTPITVRQYVREGKMHAQKLGRKWMIPVDSVARFMYNSGYKTAEESVPMGVLYAWADDDGKILADYRFVSAHELATFCTTESMQEFMELPKNTAYWCELFPVLTQDSLLEDLALITPSLNQDDRTPFCDNKYSFPATLEYQLTQLALQEWYRMPTYMVADHFKTILGREPDIIDLRLLRIALLAMLSVNDSEGKLADAHKWLHLGPMSHFPRP